MDPKKQILPTDTHVLDDDVMEEMENLEDTFVLEGPEDRLLDGNIHEDELLDDIETATVVLDSSRSKS